MFIKSTKFNFKYELISLNCSVVGKLLIKCNKLRYTTNKKKVATFCLM